MKKIILDLCGGTGSWSRPYKEASEYEMKTRIALEELAEKLKNEGVSAWEGQSYILKIK